MWNPDIISDFDENDNEENEFNILISPTNFLLAK